MTDERDADERAADEHDPDGTLDPEIAAAIEAVVMVAEQPVPAAVLAQLCQVSEDQVVAHCAALAAGYEAQGRGFVLVDVAGGYRFQSHDDQAPFVERYVLEGQSSRLSGAALETLAIVGYKQPISRMQVAAIRGVNVDAVVRTLTQRGYIAEIGRDPGPGQAVLYGTTPYFLEKLGLASLDDLPPLADFVPGPEVVEALEVGLRLDESSDDDNSADEGGHDETSDADSADDSSADEGGDAEIQPAVAVRHPGQTEAVVIDLSTRNRDGEAAAAGD